MINEWLMREIKQNWAGLLRCDIAGCPQPTILLGTGSAWNSLEYDVCPVCKGLHLPVEAYCLRCDRSGLMEADGMTPVSTRKKK